MPFTLLLDLAHLQVSCNSLNLNFDQEAKKLFHYIKGGNDRLNQMKCEQMFVQLLEGLQENEAEVVILAKDKILHQKYKGLSQQVVKEAFSWDDDYLNTRHPKYKKAG